MKHALIHSGLGGDLYALKTVLRENCFSGLVTKAPAAQAPASDDKIKHEKQTNKQKLNRNEFFLVWIFQVRVFQPKGFHFFKMNWVSCHLRN